MKPYAKSCEQNQAVILDVIKPLLANSQTVLEIGSGTGQHAVYFSQEIPHLYWQTSDCVEHHEGIQQWIDDVYNEKLLAPIALNVGKNRWPAHCYNTIFTANTLHIMSHKDVLALFAQLPTSLQEKGQFIVYGPFNYHGHYTSQSNERFDEWLHSRDPDSGIKDFEWLNELAGQAGLKLTEDYTMPANNRILCWQKV